MSLFAALGASYLAHQIVDRPYKSAICATAGIGTYLAFKRAEPQIDSISEKLALLSEQFKAALISSLSIPMLHDFDFLSLSHAFVSFLNSVRLIPQSMFVVICTTLSVIVRKFNRRRYAVNQIKPQLMIGQSDDDKSTNKQIGELVSLLFSAICISFGIHTSKPKCFSDWTETLIKGFSYTGSRFVSMSNFFCSLFTIVNQLIDWVIAKISHSSIMARLQASQPDVVDKWLKEVDILTDARNEDKVLSSPKWLVRTLVATELGDYIFRDVMKQRPSKIAVPGLINRIVTLKRLRDKAVSWTTEVSVRSEPFCIWLSGPPGFGKSQVSNDIIFSLLESSGTTVVGNPIYDIQPGARFWCGCQGKVAGRFDDFTIISGEKAADDLSAFMQLKSPAIFVPEQAEIEDKGRPWAPKLLAVCCNEAFPQPLEIRTQKAFWRRRDCLVYVTYANHLDSFIQNQIPFDSPDVAAAHKKYVEENNITSKYSHLKFAIYKDSANPSSGMSEYMSYEDLIPIVQELEGNYRSKQDFLFRQTLDKINSLQVTEVDDESPLQEILDRIKSNVDEVLVTLIDPQPYQTDIENGVVITKRWINKLVDGTFLFQSFASILSYAKPNVTSAFSTIQQNFGMKGEGAELIDQELENEISEVPDLEVLSIRSLRPESLPTLGDECTANRFKCNCLHVNKFNLFNTDCVKWDIDRKLNKWYFRNQTLDLFCGPDCIFIDEQAIDDLKKRKHSIYAIIESNKDIFYPQTSLANLETPVVAESTKGFIPTMCEFLKTTFGLILASIQALLSNALTYFLGALGVFYYLYKRRSTAIACSDNVPQEDNNSNTNVLTTSSNQEVFVPSLIDLGTDQAQIARSGDTKTTNAKKTRFKGVKIKSFTAVKSQSHGQFTENIKPLISRNLVFLRWYKKLPTGEPDPETIVTSRAYGLFEYNLMTLKHYWSNIKAAGCTHMQILSRNCTLCTECSLSSIEFLPCEESEYVIAVLPPNTVTMFRDIRKHFGSVSQFEAGLYPTRGFAFYQKADTDEINNISFSYSFTPETVIDDHGEQTSTIIHPIKYTWSGRGFCMSPICAEMCGAQFIVGFHIAGSPKQGVALGMCEPLFKEQLDSIPSIGFIDREEIDSSFIGNGDPAITIDTSVVPLHTLNYNHPQAIKTQIVSSHIQPRCDVKPLTQPAPLCRSMVPNRAFDPMEEGVAFHGEPLKPYDLVHYQRAHEDYTEMILSNCIPVSNTVRVLTVEESIEGIPEIDFKSMELSTSEGFPYLTKRPTKSDNSKRWLVKVESSSGRNKLQELHPMVTKEMDRKDRLRIEGLVPCTVFVDCEKDCRIPNEKMSVPGATRIFSTCPLDFTIQFRQYFGSFLCAYKKNRLNLEHAVGIAVQGPEWTLIADYLRQGFTKFLDGDYKKFGPRLDTRDSMDFCRTINDWYRKFDRFNPNIEQDCKKRTCMILESSQAAHLCRNLLYLTLSGMPSGFPGTVEFNNASNSKGIRRAWLYCWSDDPSMCNMASFRKHIRLICYGDDIVIAVSDEAIGRFNNIFLQQYFAEHGMIYTDARKSKDVLPYVSFDQISFLKHMWVPHPERIGMYMSRLDIKSIHECYLWVHRPATHYLDVDLIEPTMTNCEMSLLLSYGHGPEFYNNLRKFFVDWYQSVKYDYPHIRNPRFYTWRELDNIIYPSDMSQVDESECLRIQRIYDSYIERCDIVSTDP